MFGLKPFRYLAKPIRILLISNAFVFGLCFLMQFFKLNELYFQVLSY